MSTLEQLTPGTSVRGLVPDASVTVVAVQWFGDSALELTYKTADGKVANELLYRHDEPRLEVVEQGRPWSFDGDGATFRLVSEAHRIRLAAGDRILRHPGGTLVDGQAFELAKAAPPAASAAK